ncbi:hypothetical protein M885DRAFT_285061 [Pelagophyceae sp. CCMP2097]|nr:hypothetical protein M885DRAFT_285061 [Pelagophyceae sp. CCMP2097]
MQLASEARPEIERTFGKRQLVQFRFIFTDVSRGSGALRAAQMLAVLKKCCAAAGDTETGKRLNKRNVRKVVELYDSDGSGAIEWEEFLNIMTDLNGGRLARKAEGIALAPGENDTPLELDL